jgi:hypothetical protein
MVNRYYIHHCIDTRKDINIIIILINNLCIGIITICSSFKAKKPYSINIANGNSKKSDDQFTFSQLI